MPAKRKKKIPESKSYKKKKCSEDNKIKEGSEKNKNKIICDDCGDKFKRKENLETHIVTAHSPTILKFLCPLWPACSKVRLATGCYSTYENLVTHFRKHHRNEPIPKKDDVKTVKFKRNDMNGGTFDFLPCLPMNSRLICFFLLHLSGGPSVVESDAERDHVPSHETAKGTNETESISNLSQTENRNEIETSQHNFLNDTPNVGTFETVLQNESAVQTDRMILMHREVQTDCLVITRDQATQTEQNQQENHSALKESIDYSKNSFETPKDSPNSSIGSCDLPITDEQEKRDNHHDFNSFREATKLPNDGELFNIYYFGYIISNFMADNKYEFFRLSRKRNMLPCNKRGSGQIYRYNC